MSGDASTMREAKGAHKRGGGPSSSESSADAAGLAAGLAAGFAAGFALAPPEEGTSLLVLGSNSGGRPPSSASSSTGAAFPAGLDAGLAAARGTSLFVFGSLVEWM